MKPEANMHCTAFAGTQQIATGEILSVVAKTKAHLLKHPKSELLIFDDETSHPLEIDFRGSAEAVLRRLEKDWVPEPEKPAGPGRPKLGVVSREISLLPRHWEWLAGQPGGASVTLRKLVDEAKKKNQALDDRRRAQEATHRFLSAMAGNLPHYEEVLRAFYAKDIGKFEKLMADWPKDVRNHTQKLAHVVFQK